MRKDRHHGHARGGRRPQSLTDAAVAKFRKDCTRHLAEQSKGSAQRIATRRAVIRALEAKRSNFKDATGQGHINPTILEGLSETEACLATLLADAEADAGNVAQIPTDIGALYRAHIDALAETLSGGDVIGRASDHLHELVEQIVVTWDEGGRAHHLDLAGDLVQLLFAGDNKKAAILSGAACSLRLVAGTCNRRSLPELKCAV